MEKERENKRPLGVKLRLIIRPICNCERAFVYLEVQESGENLFT
jgi:hypothetical protein